MLKIQPIASGSKGNCIFVASDTTKVLVDVGLTFRETLRRLLEAEIEPETVDAILITHEHSDHIKGVSHFIKKYPTKIYMPECARRAFCREIGDIPRELLYTFDEQVEIGDMDVRCFDVPHDSSHCFGYTFTKNKCKIAIATDLGRTTDNIISNLAGSQIVLLECNHDTLKLHNNAKYPNWLKRRIAGSFGHLNNAACSLAICKLAGQGIQQVILAHLSEENNAPTLAHSFVSDFLATRGIVEGRDIAIDIAHQHEIGMVYQID